MSYNLSCPSCGRPEGTTNPGAPDPSRANGPEHICTHCSHSLAETLNFCVWKLPAPDVFRRDFVRDGINGKYFSRMARLICVANICQAYASSRAILLYLYRAELVAEFMRDVDEFKALRYRVER